MISIGCGAKENAAGRRINPQNQAQVRSLSVIGPKQASILTEKLRDFRITTDAGQTWATPPGSVEFECATMLDGARGWAVNHHGEVLATRSAGASWSKVSALKDFTGSNQIEFIDENNGWIREFLSIWSTRDGGVTWHEVFSTATSGVTGQPSGMYVINDNTVVVSGSDGQIYLTKDRGQTWNVQTLIPADASFSDVWFVDQNHGWVAGYIVIVAGQSLRPLLFETNDGGTSWQQKRIDSDVLPSSVCFVGNEGWLAGRRRIVHANSHVLQGGLLHTTDGGSHWNEVQFGQGEPFFSRIRFTDRDHGWLVGCDVLYRTDDGGTHWHSVLELPPLKEIGK